MDLFSPYASSLLGIALFGCFFQVLTILSLLRFGLGLSGIEMGILSLLLSFVLSIFMIETKFQVDRGLEKAVEGKSLDYATILDDKIKPFLVANSEAAIFEKLSFFKNSDNKETSLAHVEAAYLLTQLKRSFTIGLMILIPLVVIDLFVAFSLTLLGISSLPAIVLSLPLKLVLFVSIDGWNLIINKFLAGFI